MTIKTYVIRVNGSIDTLLADQIEGLLITLVNESDFILTVRLADQPALYGLIDRMNSAGLVLISLRCLGDDKTMKGAR